MRSTDTLEWIEETGRLVLTVGERGTALVPVHAVQEVADAVRSGRWRDGAVVEGWVAFPERQTAEHNAAPLEYLGLRSAHAGAVVSSGARFAVREDFGIRAPRAADSEEP